MARQGFNSQSDKEMNFEKSSDTKILESVLVEAKVGDLITYDELSKAIGRNVRVFAMPSLRSARRGVFSSKQFVFGVETGVGLRRLNDSQIVDTTESDRARMRRAANRSIKKLGVVNFAELDEQHKRKHIVSSAQMGAISMFASKSATKKIDAKVDAKKDVLAIGDTLKLFGGEAVAE